MPVRHSRPTAAASVLIVGLLASASAGIVGAGPALAAAFTPANLVVVRVGDGSAAPNGTAASVFLDEYTPAGALVQSVPMPTSAAGSNRPLTMSNSASSEGALALSADGRYLTLAGYSATPGTSSVVGTTSSATPRVVGRVAGDGTIDTSTAITDAFSANNVRGAVTDDGSQFWAVGAANGVRLAPLGTTGTTTSISTTATNLRTASIAGGQLYVTTGAGTQGVYAVGMGTPTTGPATAVLVAGASNDYAAVFLDRSAAVVGVDSLYVAIDSGGSAGVLKFSFDGTTWTARGGFTTPGAVRGLTGAVVGGTAELFATTAAGSGSIVKVTDTAAFNAAIAATSTTLVTAGSNTALRGIAFAPQSSVASAPTITAEPADSTIASGATATLSVTATGTGPLSYQWYAGAAGDTSAPIGGATSSPYTTPALTLTTTYWVRVTNAVGADDSRTATITVSAGANTVPTISPTPVQELALTIGDPFNPPALRTVDVADAESPASALAIDVTSANSAVATGDSTGTGTTRTLTVAPVGVGRTTLTVTVSDGSLTASTTFPVAISGSLPAGTLNHYGSSDASTAIDLTAGGMVVADDENNTLRSYSRTESRYPAAAFDVRAAGLALRDADPTREIDIEASARSGGTIYWLGSHGQNKDGNTRLNRQEIFSTTVTGTGTGASFAIGGSYQHLRDDLVAWDHANGHGLGPDALGLAAAATRAPEGDGVGGPTGFNIEGGELAPDGTTLYVAFRGPLTTGATALVVPVTNLAALLTGNPTTGVTATFGAPIMWDLAGRGVREIRKGPSDTYLVIAGPSSAGTGASGAFRLYSWDGDPTHLPELRTGSLDTVAAAGSPEAIVSVPDPLLGTSTIQVITDSGDTVWYGDGTAAKDLDPVVRKATSAQVAVGTPPPCSSSAATIGSVQGTGDISPVAGTTVSVRGTVVGDYEGASPALRGFYLQDSGDGDPATSDGIFVFDNGADLVSNGAVVQVTGSASEFQGQTQVTATASGVEACGSATATAVDVTLPRATAGDLEPYEGMLVRFHQTLTVTEHFQLGRFGEVLVSSGGRLRQPTAVLPATDTAGVAALQAANDLRQLIIDDDRQSQNPDPIIFGRGGAPLSATNTLRGGDTVTDPIGVLTYTWAGSAASGNAYRLRPAGALGGATVFDPVNARPTAPPTVSGGGVDAGGVKVTGANLLNLFNTFSGCQFGTTGGAADCRGAENTTEYDRQLAKEVEAISFLGADVVGYMEMENDGYGPTSAVQALVNALNLKDGAGTWAFVNPDAATGIADSAGTDAIKAGLLYRTTSVTPVAGATFADQNAIFQRRPVAQTFTTATGARLTVVANHFKSKGSCPTSGPDTDQGDGQACWNVQRTAQANELASWLQSVVVPAAGDPDVLIVGDLNAYAGEDPIAALESAGYDNLIKRFGGLDSYSYVFDGQWGYLDYALASPSLVGQATGAGDAHHNADEPSVLDYNTNFKSSGQISSLYAPDRFRTSDHDPVLVGLDLGVPAMVTGLSATATSSSRIAVTWDAVAGATSYEVRRATSAGGPFGAPKVVTTTSYANNGLTPGTAYFYVVRAVSPIGSSADSAPVSATSFAATAAPANLTVTATTASRVSLSWSSVSGATSYQLRRAAAPGGPYSPVASTTAASITDTTALPATTYFYVVVAVGPGGTSANSDPATATTAGLPSPPTGVVATAVGATRVQVTWDSVAGANGYEVWHATTSGGPYAKKATVGSPSYLHTTAAPGATQFYVVRTVVASTTSANSAEASVVTPGLPAPPTGVVATRNSPTKITVTWSPVAAATAYEVWRSTSSGGTYTKRGTVSGTSYSDTNAPVASTFFYVVRTVGSSGTSGNSAEAVV